MTGFSERNPFVGPRPIQRGEQLHGRDGELVELYNRVQARRIVVLHSPSGAGKSSLVNAGLIPRLEAGKFDVWRAIRVNLDPAGIDGLPPDCNRYLLSALVSLEDELPVERRRSPAELARLDFLEYLETRPRRKSRATRPVVLLFDQFEEILTVDPLAVAAKHEFFARIGAALDNERYWAVFIVREDYLAAFDGYREYIPTQMSNTFRLDLLGLAGAREAALRLAEAGGRAFPAVDKLIGDLSTVQIQAADGSFVARQGLHVEPVYMQVVCRRLWDAMPDDDDSIDEEDIEAYAGISESLAGYYADAVRSIADGDAAVERAVRDWVGDKLIVGGIRSQVRQCSGRSGGLDNGLIERLLDTYLVRAEQRAGSNWFELSHDRLVEPIRDDNERWEAANLEPVQVQAKLWDAGGRSHALLLGADALPDALAWAEDNPALVTEVEREFLSQSSAQRAQELRHRRMQRIVMTTIAIGAVLGFTLGGVALWLRSVAEQKRDEAEVAQAEAEAAQRSAERAQHDAEEAREKAEQAQTVAEHAKAKAEQAQHQNERLAREVLRQLFQVGLRRLLEQLAERGTHGGVIEVDGRWTPVLERNGEVFAAADVIDGGGRMVVAGHEAVLTEVDERGESAFLEITIEWLLGEQARRGVVIVSHDLAQHDRNELLRRNLSKLGYEFVLDPPLTGLANDEDAGVLIVDNRCVPALTDAELAAIDAFVRRGGGVLAVGHGSEWLEHQRATQDANATLDDYPMNWFGAALGIRWTDETIDTEALEAEEVAASVRFDNESGEVVDVLLRDRDGSEGYYTTLEVGEVEDLRTSIGHTWVVRAVASNRELGVVDIDAARQLVTIAETVTVSRGTPKPKPSGSGNAPEPGPDQPALPKTLSSAALAPSLALAEQAAKKCGQEFDSLASYVKVKVVVAPSGKVTQASVLAPMKGTTVGTCVASAVAKLRFPKSADGVSTTWTLPL